ncbi:oligomeric Golgi complex subunit 7 [Acrasis kona]|uniref:Conserved oligomeric Golgi complex subunit 7 n=1 Tax=Acrasis kona TaxID=1008807 RepID=A0AAW2ZB20_9EUKA
MQSIDVLKQRLQHILNTLSQARTLSVSLQSLDDCFSNINRLLSIQNNDSNEQLVQETGQDASQLLSDVEKSVTYLKEYDVVEKQSLERIDQYRDVLTNKIIAPRFTSCLIQHDMDGANTQIANAEKLGSKSVENIFDEYADKITEPLMSDTLPLTDTFREITYLIEREARYYSKLNVTKLENDSLLWCTNRLLHYLFVTKQNFFNTKLNQEKKDVDHLVSVLYVHAKSFLKNIKSTLFNEYEKPPTDWEQIEKNVFDLFVPIQQTYVTDLEKKNLMEKCVQENIVRKLKDRQINISSNAKTSQLDKSDSIIRIVEESVPPLFSSCTAALERCILFTGAMESQILIRVLNQVFVEYSDTLNKVINFVRSEIQKARQNSRNKKDNKTSLGVKSSSETNIDNDILHLCLKLYEVIASDQSDHGLFLLLKSFEDQTHSSLLQEKHSIDRDRYVHLITQQQPERSKQIQNFFRSLEEVRLPIFTQSKKHFEQLQTNVVTLLNDTLFYAIQQALLEFSIKQKPVEEYQNKQDSDDDSDDDEEELGNESLPASEYMFLIGDYIITLPEKLESLPVTEVQRRTYRICQDTINGMREQIVKKYSKANNPQPWTKFARIQFLSDLDHLKVIFDQIGYQCDEAGVEFFELSKSIVKKSKATSTTSRLKNVSNAVHAENTAPIEVLKHLTITKK